MRDDDQNSIALDLVSFTSSPRHVCTASLQTRGETPYNVYCSGGIQVKMSWRRAISLSGRSEQLQRLEKSHSIIRCGRWSRLTHCYPSKSPSTTSTWTRTWVSSGKGSVDTKTGETADTSTSSENVTHFGFETIASQLKEGKVAQVFSSVASSYDTMNDLMSLGIHRLWKDHFVRSLDPGINPILSAAISSSDTASYSPSSSEPAGLNVLDVAGGTGDIAFRILDYAQRIHNDTSTCVTVADINPAMLAQGKSRASLLYPATASPHYSAASSPSPATMTTDSRRANSRLCFVKANAESMPDIPSGSIDLYTVAFGIRNFTNIPRALQEAYRVLKPGGVFACLEFSKVQNPAFDWLYKRWSFGAIPIIGQIAAGDRDSYQYLVESIDRFPSQTAFANLIRQAGFEVPARIGEADRGGWENLSGGIACIHKGVKPIETDS